MTATTRAASAPIVAALIGAGNSGGHYHLPHLLASPRIELVAVATASGRVGVALPDSVAVVRGWREVMSRSAVELVVIATPHHLHYEIAAAALASGKHVLVEKPVTATAAEAERLGAEAERRGLVVAVFHQRRFEADYLAVLDIVRSGEIGDVQRVVAARSHQGDYLTSTSDAPHVGAAPLDWARRRASGGGVARIIGPHPIDQVLHLVGEDVARASARARVEPGEEVESWIAIDLAFATGATATVEAFRRSGIAPPRFSVYGSEGAVVASDGTQVRVRSATGSRTVEGLAPPSALGVEIYDDLIAAVREGRPLRVALGDAVAVVDVLERADRSLRDLLPVPRERPRA